MSRQTELLPNPYGFNIPRPMATPPSAPPFTLSNESAYGHPTPPPPPPPLPPPPYHERIVNVHHNHQNTSYPTESQTVLIVPVKREASGQSCARCFGSLVTVIVIIGVIYGVFRVTFNHGR